MSPAHHRPQRRWRILLVVALVLAGVGVAAASQTPAPSTATPTPSALVGAPDAESSAWYCVGQTTSSGLAPGFLVLTNTTGEAVTTTIAAMTDGGTSTRTAVSVPAHDVVTPAIAPLSSGYWEAETVTVEGGGVAVSQALDGQFGWTQVPCQSSTSSQWYFPGGTTSNGDGLSMVLLNPTSTPVVVDLGFRTPGGPVNPINYQGIVLQPGQVLGENVASEVQNASTVSSVVSTRTGRVVASEVQTFLGASMGLAVVPGAAAPDPLWFIPQAQEAAGASSEIDIFNPGGSPEPVTVHLRLPSGPLAPLSDTVAPGATWVLRTSKQTRIPAGATYSAEVESSGGPGVVVGRTIVLAASAPAPQAGMSLAVNGVGATSPTGEWVVPPPGTSATPAVSGAKPAMLGLFNASDATEHFTAEAVTSTGALLVGAGTVAPGATAVFSGSPVFAAGFDPIFVRADGAMAVGIDTAPTGGLGVVEISGIPLAAPIAL